MASTAALEILLTAKDQASPILEKTSGSMGKFGGAAKAAFGVITGAAASGAIGILADAARAAAEDEANTLKLQTALEATGVTWEANSAAVEARIKKGQELAFSDSEVRDSIAQLTTATGDVNKAMEMQGLVMDIARGRGISLAQATDIAQKAALGQTGALKKLGIVLAEGATATDALAALQGKYANQAEAYGTTTEASIFKVKDAIGEWTESMGATLGPAQGIIAMLPGLSTGMTLAGGAVGGLKVAFFSAIPAILATVVAMGPILLVVGAIALAILGLKLAWDNNLGDIQGKTQAVMAVVGPLLEGIIGTLGRFIEFAGRAIEFASRLPGVQGIANFVGNVVGGIGSAIGGATTPPTLSGLGLAEGSAGPIFAAHGFDGMVSRPTMFVAGEAGREHVRITPGGRASGGLTVNVNVHGSVIGVSDLRDEVVSAVREAISGGGFRGVLTPARV